MSVKSELFKGEIWQRELGNRDLTWDSIEREERESRPLTLEDLGLENKKSDSFSKGKDFIIEFISDGTKNFIKVDNEKFITSLDNKYVVVNNLNCSKVIIDNDIEGIDTLLSLDLDIQKLNLCKGYLNSLIIKEPSLVNFNNSENEKTIKKFLRRECNLQERSSDDDFIEHRILDCRLDCYSLICEENSIYVETEDGERLGSFEGILSKFNYKDKNNLECVLKGCVLYTLWDKKMAYEDFVLFFNSRKFSRFVSKILEI